MERLFWRIGTNPYITTVVHKDAFVSAIAGEVLATEFNVLGGSEVILGGINPIDSGSGHRQDLPIGSFFVIFIVNELIYSAADMVN